MLEMEVDEEEIVVDEKPRAAHLHDRTNPPAGSAGAPNAEDAFLQEEIDVVDAEEEEIDFGDEDEDRSSRSDTANEQNARTEKSLGTLTKRFIKFLQESPAGNIDINSAADKLNVSQKRRIYDITNVLEGIGLIEKKSKNLIMWKGGQLRKPGGEIDLKPADERKLMDIKHDLTDLEREERLLDTHLKWIKQSMRNVCEDMDIYRYAFVLKEEAASAFENERLLLLQAPPGTDIQVGQPAINLDDVRYSLKAKSHSGPAIISSVTNEKGHSVIRRTIRQERPQAAGDKLGEVPTNILEDEEEDAAFKRDQMLEEEVYEIEPLRVLSPPPSELDYTLGQHRGETIADIYNDDGF
ncbi:E2F-TDP domain-containing protein [Aphelenchoides fujianensis]|nr:E2F-TDP domain-containing protein [Aphelenchoides fujianensis]